MLKKICEYKFELKKTLADAGRYRPEYDPYILDLATAQYICYISQYIIDNLDTVLTTTTTNGYKRVREHPIYKTLREASKEIEILSNKLGLTVTQMRK